MRAMAAEDRKFGVAFGDKQDEQARAFAYYGNITVVNNERAFDNARIPLWRWIHTAVPQCLALSAW